METNEKITKIFNRFPGALLEKNRFGRSENFGYWLSAAHLVDVCRAMRDECGYVWLENFSCIQVDQSLVFNYFLHSHTNAEHYLILRLSMDIPQGSSLTALEANEVGVPSVASVWASAEAFETEIAALFGVRFVDSKGEVLRQGSPENWNGFPLRKDFVFPDAERAGGFR